jgi:aldose 1-epimerase
LIDYEQYSLYQVQQASFQKKVDDKPTDLYYLKNKRGMIAAITNYGARLVSLIVPDKNEETNGCSE